MDDDAQVEAAARAARSEFSRGYLPDLWTRVARAAITAAAQVLHACDQPGCTADHTFRPRITPLTDDRAHIARRSQPTPVVVSAEQVEAAAIAMTEPSLWDDPRWHPTFHGDTRSPEERREHFRNGVREKVCAALATLPGITVEPTP